MNQDQKNKVIECLKAGKIQSGGQTFETLANVAGVDWEWKHQLSYFLQKLARKGKVSYFSRNKVWYWNGTVSIDDFQKPKTTQS